MIIRYLVLFAILLVAGTSVASAKSRHPHRPYVNATLVPPPPAFTGPTLVKHPASNIACNTPYRATRPLPCDQPVWVYGDPCEIDLGLGRYRACN